VVAATLYADMANDRASSVITVANRLREQVANAGIEVEGRGIIAGGPMGRTARTPVGWFHGYPHQLRDAPMLVHPHRIAGLQTDALPAPAGWAKLCRRLTAAYFPSRWCARVFRDVLPTGCEAFVVPHGIDAPHPCTPPGLPARFTALTISLPDRGQPGVEPHHLRKGVDLAIEATRIAGIDLVLRAGDAARKWADDADHVTLLDSYLHPGELSELFRGVHVVLVPSRAEAFGIVAAEALAHGTPVVATLGSGMADYLPNDCRAVTVAPSGEFEQLATFGFPDGKVHTIRAETVADALIECRRNYLQRRNIARQRADAWAEAHSWKVAARPLIDWLRAHG